MNDNGKFMIKVTIGIKHPQRIRENVEALQRISRMEKIGQIDGAALMDTIKMMKGIQDAVRRGGIL